jgi:hypothetical protein
MSCLVLDAQMKYTEAMLTRVKDLHLAAYMKYHGAVFTEYRSGYFWFETDLSESEWRVRHSNSCCRGVDFELLSLKKFLRS